LSNVEAITVYVLPSDVSVIIQQMNLFGWKMVGNEDAGVRWDKDLSWYFNSVKSTTSYYCRKLDFVRKLDLPNLDKIRALEKNYIFGGLPNVSSNISKKAEPDWFWTLDMLTLIFGGLGTVFFLATFFGVKNSDWNFSYGGGLVGFAIAAGAWALKRGAKYLFNLDQSQTRINQQNQYDNIKRNREEIEQKLLALK